MLNVSIVLYNPDWKQVTTLTRALLECSHVRRIYWVDNSPTLQEPPALSDKVRYIFNNQNLGYGAAHNIAIRESIYDDIPFHLVVNPDIVVTSDVITTLLQFILQHQEIGLIAPKVIYPNGELQYLCKLLPTPFDVFGRRFLPKSWTRKRNNQYDCAEYQRADENSAHNPDCHTWLVATVLHIFIPLNYFLPSIDFV